MAAILFFGDFLLLLFYLLGKERDPSSAFAVSFVKALVIFSLFVCLLTEALSLFNEIGYAPLVTAYGAVFGMLFIVAVRSPRQSSTAFRHLEALYRGVRAHKVAIVLSVILFVAPLLFIGIYYPPNNMDSMAYHLPRIEHWIQDGNLLPYPTDYLAQIFNQPLDEYVLLDLFLLSANDYLLFVVQFAAALGTLCAVTLIVREMGFPGRMALLSGLTTATIPIGVLESTSTQTDYVAAFFVCAFVLFGLQTVRQGPSAARRDRLRRADMLFMAFSAALGALAKLTVGVFIVPFALWFAVELALARRIASLSLSIGTVMLAVLITNSMYYERNLQSSGHLFGPPSGLSTGLSVGGSHLKALLSNSLKNVAMQLSTPSPSINRALEGAVASVSRLFGVDSNGRGLNDRDQPFTLPNFNFSEDSAGNPTTVLLFIAALVLLAGRAAHNRRDLLIFGFCVILGLFLLSSGMRWQVYGSRYLLPLFALSTVVVGPVLGSYGRTLGGTAVLVAAIWSLPYVYFNYNRPLLPVYSIARHYRELIRYLPPSLSTQSLQSMDAAGRATVMRVYAPAGNGYERDPAPDPRDRTLAFDTLLRDHLSGVPTENPLARSRFLSYFSYKTAYGDDYVHALSQASRNGAPGSVGLRMRGMTWEYPVWSWFRQRGGPMPFISSVGQPDDYTPAPVNATVARTYDWMIVQDGVISDSRWHLIGDSPRVKVYERARHD